MAPSPASRQQSNGSREYADSWRAIMHLVRSGHSWSGNERNCVFLNLAEADGTHEFVPRFTNASAVTGLDAPEDGRGLAITDWDDDGDLDLWFRNRNAPRLRLMRNLTNEIAPDDQHIALRLIGTTCNRDAIGARAELEVTRDRAASRRIVRSVRAGDGFLSQSSKRLHFGVKSDAEITQLIVTWPGGDREAFAGLSAGASFEITQGTGRAVRVGRREPVRLEAKPYAPLPATAAARIVLPGRVAFPPIDLQPDKRSKAVPFHVDQAATLIMFWTSSCPNCRRELSEIAQHGTEFRDAGLSVVAICLDGLNPPDGTLSKDNDDQGAEEFLQSIDFPFLTRHATPKTIERVRHFQNVLFSTYPGFVVPLSFLVDSEGQVVSIYRGAFSPQALLRDRALVDQDDEALRTLAPPLLGTWITQPATRTQIADFLAGRTVATDPVVALRYYEWAIESEPDANRRQTLQDRIDQLQLITAGRD